MFQVIEWDLPTGAGGVMAAALRHSILEQLNHCRRQHGIQWQPLEPTPKYQLRVLIDDHDLTLLCLIWPRTESRFDYYLTFRILGLAQT